MAVIVVFVGVEQGATLFIKHAPAEFFTTGKDRPTTAHADVEYTRLHASTDDVVAACSSSTIVDTMDIVWQHRS